LQTAFYYKVVDTFVLLKRGTKGLQPTGQDLHMSTNTQVEENMIIRALGSVESLLPSVFNVGGRSCTLRSMDARCQKVMTKPQGLASSVLQVVHTDSKEFHPATSANVKTRRRPSQPASWCHKIAAAVLCTKSSSPLSSIEHSRTSSDHPGSDSADVQPGSATWHCYFTQYLSCLSSPSFVSALG
jgi:hypothetical protein